MDENIYTEPQGYGTSRNIALCIVLSLFTCGIYGLYWMYCLNEEINSLSGENGTNGALVIILSIVTCNIYTWYWLYKMGEGCDIIKDKIGKPGASGYSPVLFLIFGLVGLNIVAYALMQDAINSAVS